MGNVTSLTNGQILQIAYTMGVFSQMNRKYRDWDVIATRKKGGANGRRLDYLMQTSLGVAAIQAANAGAVGTFPAAQQVTTREGSGQYKEIDATIQIPISLMNRMRQSPAKYADYLDMEISSKADATKRLLTMWFQGDGTGVMGTVLTENTTSNEVTVTLNSSSGTRGFVGWFHEDELLNAFDNDGTAATAPTVTGTFAHWKVIEKKRELNQIILKACAADGTELPCSASNLAAGDVFYRLGQTTPIDLTGAISDYGTVSENLTGLQSLVANDGRVVHGITRRGVTGGTHLDASGAQFDTQLIQRLMSRVKVRVGDGSYQYKKLMSSPETIDAVIESRSTDQRFIRVEDNKRGVPHFAYIHGTDSLELCGSEFTPHSLAYAIPEGEQDGAKVIEYRGSEFEQVKVGGQSEFMLPGTNGYQRAQTSFMQAIGEFMCFRPAAVGVIKNFVTGQ